MRALPVLMLLAAAGCAEPPPSAYLGGGGATSGGLGLGRDTAGESCTENGRAIFCGTFRSPSGEVADAGPAGPANLASIATDSAWRSTLDGRFNCAAPVATTILGGAPALEMSCTRRIGGWPQVALVAAIDGHAYTADGILPAEPVLERAIGVRSGRVAPQAAPALPPGEAEGLIAARLAAQPFSAGDVGRYQDLMLAGLRANLDESYVPAEQAYRAAWDVQRKALGRDDPATAVAMMLVALQLADQGRGPEADTLFARAARLAPDSPNSLALAQLAHYRALALLDEGRPEAALPLLDQAERDYAAQLPSQLLARDGGSALGTGSVLPLDPDTQAALIGVIETRRYQAICLRDLGRTREAHARIEAAAHLADAAGLHQRNLTARLYRTEAEIDDRLAAGSGRASLGLASRDFALAQPGSRPVAQTELLRAAQALGAGETTRAIGFCRQAAQLLRTLKAGTSADLIEPCLTAYARQAAADPTQRQALLADMFDAAQFVQGSVTSRQIALAAARLATGSRDPAVAAAIRRQQDASLELTDLERQRDMAASTGTVPPDLLKRLDAAHEAMTDSDAVLQAAAPNYGQLVQEAVSAHDVFAALAPDEAFVSIALTPHGGWVFALARGTIAAAPAGTDEAGMAALVRRIRASIEPNAHGLPAYDVADARTLYDDTIGPVAPSLAGAHALVVAPAGPLLSLPFGLLLSGPADAASLGHAPFLVRRFAISHVPAPANFVSLRRAAAQTQGTRPWVGFGDFRPATLAQAEATFPSRACADSARLFAGLPPLPFAGKELIAARELLGGSPADELTGAAFTAPAVLHEDLGGFRVVHFATHALLPTDLACETEPAIITSVPTGAANATGALLRSDDIMGLHLDADAVIISACNSAGPDGQSAGESLSGLARAFFYAGARAVMVSHWSVNDQATAYIVAQTLARVRKGDGFAAALQGGQLAMLDGAGASLPADVAHPFFWAPFAIVGEGHARPGAATFARE